MNLRIGLFLTVSVLTTACSERTSNQNKDIVESEPSTLTSSNNKGKGTEVSIVCGVLYKVNDFNIWLEEYKNIAKGTIIMLRNTDDPSLVVVFEGKENLEMAERRTLELTSDRFIDLASVEGQPIVTNHSVEYYKPPSSDFKQYVALNFNSPDIKLLIRRLERDGDLFAQYGLTVMGVGTNVSNENEVYILLTLDDFVSFRQTTNSPGKIRKFIKSLNLPQETFISDWTKTSL